GGDEERETEDRQSECGDEHPCLLLCPWPSRSALCGSHPRIYVGPRPRSRGGDRSGSGSGLLGARAAVPLGALIARAGGTGGPRSEEHTSELQSRFDLVCRLLLEK